VSRSSRLAPVATDPPPPPRPPHARTKCMPTHVNARFPIHNHEMGMVVQSFGDSGLLAISCDREFRIESVHCAGRPCSILISTLIQYLHFS
jgi:hypothetical protein